MRYTPQVRASCNSPKSLVWAERYGSASSPQPSPEARFAKTGLFPQWVPCVTSPAVALLFGAGRGLKLLLGGVLGEDARSPCSSECVHRTMWNTYSGQVERTLEVDSGTGDPVER